MRPIKYRAWDKTEKKMYDLRDMYFNVSIDHPRVVFEMPFEMVDEDWKDHDLVLLAFTGLHDRNGTEIYESDIIEFTYNTGYSTPIVIGIVEFGEYCAGSNDYGDLISLGFYVAQERLNSQEWNLFDDEIKKGRVIGNIYQNPGLLKGE